MAKPDTLIIDGHGYSWNQLCELRREQLEARKAAQPRELALFEFKEDCRPATEGTAIGRYEQPTFLDPNLRLSKPLGCVV
jgi:hypothetical protein